MTQRFYVHPDNPQPRLLNQIADIIRSGGVVIYPTDSCYAFACALGEKKSLDRIKQIRQLRDKHLFTLMCKDLAEVAEYAKVENNAYRFIKAITPGPFTFVLKAKNKVPRRLMHPTRKTIGFRIPDNNIAIGLLDVLGEPLMTTSLMLPGDEMPYDYAEIIFYKVSKMVEVFVDGGTCGFNVTTVINMVDGTPELIRQGIGDVSEYL